MSSTTDNASASVAAAAVPLPTLTAPSTESLVYLTSYQRGQLAHLNCFPPETGPSSSPGTAAAPAAAETTTSSHDKNNTKQPPKISLEEAREALATQVTLMFNEETQQQQSIRATTATATTPSKQQQQQQQQGTTPNSSSKDREDVRKAVLGMSSSKRRKVDPPPTVGTIPPSSSNSNQAAHTASLSNLPSVKKMDSNNTVILDAQKAQDKYKAALQEWKKKQADLSSLKLQADTYAKSNDIEVVSRLHQRIQAVEPRVRQAQEQLINAQAVLQQAGIPTAARATTTTPQGPPSPRVAPPPAAAKAPPKTPRVAKPESPKHADAKEKLMEGLLASAQQQDEAEEARKAMRTAAEERYDRAFQQYTKDHKALNEAEQALLSCLRRGENSRVAREKVDFAKRLLKGAASEKEEAEAHLRVVLDFGDEGSS